MPPTPSNGYYTATRITLRVSQFVTRTSATFPSNFQNSQSSSRPLEFHRLPAASPCGRPSARQHMKPIFQSQLIHCVETYTISRRSTFRRPPRSLLRVWMLCLYKGWEKRDRLTRQRQHMRRITGLYIAVQYINYKKACEGRMIASHLP